MDKIKAIFVDFDWTIYDHNVNGINMSGIAALNRAKDKGIKVIINSARTYFSLEGMDHIFDLVDFDAFSCSTGLIDLTKDKTLSVQYIDEDLVRQIIEVANANHISYLLSYDRVSYLKTYDPDIISRFYDVFHEPRGIEMVDGLSLDNVYAIQLYLEAKDDYLFEKFHDVLHFDRFFEVAVEIHPIIKHKGHSIENLMDYFNLKPEECIAIGDSTDDIQMFKRVKYGICMGNGTDDAKESAYLVTDTIENDGLDKALKQFDI